jgi:hypothetical protein
VGQWANVRPWRRSRSATDVEQPQCWCGRAAASQSTGPAWRCWPPLAFARVSRRTAAEDEDEDEDEDGDQDEDGEDDGRGGGCKSKQCGTGVGVWDAAVGGALGLLLAENFRSLCWPSRAGATERCAAPMSARASKPGRVRERVGRPSWHEDGGGVAAVRRGPRDQDGMVERASRRASGRGGASLMTVAGRAAPLLAGAQRCTCLVRAQQAAAAKSPAWAAMVPTEPSGARSQPGLRATRRRPLTGRDDAPQSVVVVVVVVAAAALLLRLPLAIKCRVWSAGRPGLCRYLIDSPAPARILPGR